MQILETDEIVCLGGLRRCASFRLIVTTPTLTTKADQNCNAQTFDNVLIFFHFCIRFINFQRYANKILPGPL